MTPNQKGRYWRDWARVRKILTEMGEFSAKEADEQRHQIHLEALGVNKSSKDFTARDLDKIFAAFDAYLVLENGPRKGPAENQPVKRLIYSIEALGLPEPYIQSIARDKEGTSDWKALPEANLRRLCITLHARARARKATS
jgi:hypothetical protein